MYIFDSPLDFACNIKYFNSEKYCHLIKSFANLCSKHSTWMTVTFFYGKSKLCKTMGTFKGSHNGHFAMHSSKNEPLYHIQEVVQNKHDTFFVTVSKFGTRFCDKELSNSKNFPMVISQKYTSEKIINFPRIALN